MLTEGNPRAEEGPALAGAEPFPKADNARAPTDV
jgi:hypothetical protein